MDVEYVVFPDEGHGFVKKENEIEGYRKVVEFLDRYMKNTPAEASSGNDAASGEAEDAASAEDGGHTTGNG